MTLTLTLTLTTAHDPNPDPNQVAANCDGFLFSKILSLLHSIHLGPRTIWLLLVGQRRPATALAVASFAASHALAAIVSRYGAIKCPPGLSASDDESEQAAWV